MVRTDPSNPSLSAVEGSTQRLPDDDVSPLELWSALIRRKTLILAILLISLITAGLFIFFTPPVYESRAVLQIGQIGQIGQIESPAVVTKRVVVQEDIDRGKATTDKARPFIQTAFLEKDTNLISIIARGPAPDATRVYLAQVVESVMHEHQKLFDLARKEQQQSMNLMQMRSHGLNQAIAANEKEMGVSARQPTISANTPTVLETYIFALERSKLLEQRTLLKQKQMDLEQKQMDLRMAMSALQSKPTVLVRAPTLTADPIRPRPLLYFALAIGIGLMLGIFSALAIEFINKARMSTSS